MEIKGNTVLVTGGTPGIGCAIAKAFSAAGNTVIVSCRDQKKLDQAAASMPNLCVMQSDVSDAASNRQ